MIKLKSILLLLFVSIIMVIIWEVSAIQKNNQIISSELTDEIFETLRDGNTEKFKHWMKSGLNVNLEAQKGITLLSMACLFGHIDIISILIKVGANIESRDRIGNTVLISSCSNSNSRLLELIVKEDKNMIPLRKAAPNIEIVALLLEFGANVKARNKLGDTSLHKACIDGLSGIVELLIKTNVDVNAIGRFGNTPLHNAAQHGHKEIVKLLLSTDVSSSINIRNEFKETPLFIARDEGFVEIAEMLVKSGATS